MDDVPETAIGIQNAPESINTLVTMVRKNCALIENLIGHLSPVRNPVYRTRYPLAIQTAEMLQSIVNRLEDRNAIKRDTDNILVPINEGGIEE